MSDLTQVEWRKFARNIQLCALDGTPLEGLWLPDWLHKFEWSDEVADAHWLWLGAHTHATAKGTSNPPKGRYLKGRNGTPYFGVKYNLPYAICQRAGVRCFIHRLLYAHFVPKAEASGIMRNQCGRTLCVNPRHWVQHSAQAAQSTPPQAPQEPQAPRLARQNQYGDFSLEFDDATMAYEALDAIRPDQRPATFEQLIQHPDLFNFSVSAIRRALTLAHEESYSNENNDLHVPTVPNQSKSAI